MADKKVVLFSGGMDSYCLLHKVNPDVILFFDLGTEDNKKEIEIINRMNLDQVTPYQVPITIVKLHLVEWEMKNKIIPHRNSILALIAGNYGNQIYMGATSGDTTKDKDFIFKSQIEGMLNYFALDSHKTIEKAYPFALNMPFKELSKAGILDGFIKANGDVNKLLKYSRSCYSGNEKECGECRACLRKAVALVLNFIPIKDTFEKDPFLAITYEGMKKLETRGQEYLDYEKAKDKHFGRNQE